MENAIASHSCREMGHVQNEHPIRSNGSCLFTITQVQQGARGWLISFQSIFLA